jgi:hypothetical protein
LSFTTLYRMLGGGTRAAVLAATILTWGAIPARTQGVAQTEAPNTSCDEKRAQELHQAKKAYTFEDLLHGNPQAIADDKQLFALTCDAVDKRRIAGILVSLGVKDQVYFDYLTNGAKEALNNDMPWPMAYDENGEINDKATAAYFDWCKKFGLNPDDPKIAPLKGVSSAFLEWCIKHEVHPSEALHEAYYVIPDPWDDLAAASDPRAYDLLIEGIHSHNLMIAGIAARGLARLQDPRAIAELIATGRRVGSEARYYIGVSLLYFSDTKAQAAAEEFIKDKDRLAMERKEMQTRGLKGLFPY